MVEHHLRKLDGYGRHPSPGRSVDQITVEDVLYAVSRIPSGLSAAALFYRHCTDPPASARERLALALERRYRRRVRRPDRWAPTLAVALWEFRDPRVCPTCKGEGRFTMRKGRPVEGLEAICERCGGSGRLHRSMAVRAAAAGVSKATWLQTYDRVADEMIACLRRWERAGVRQVREQLDDVVS